MNKYMGVREGKFFNNRMQLWDVERTMKSENSNNWFKQEPSMNSKTNG